MFNPAAGRGRVKRDPASVSAGFAARGLEHEVVLTKHAGHAAEIVRERGAAFDVVVVVGGDGTLHEAIQAMDLARHRLAVIPWGSGNDFAWMTGWPRNLDTCLDRVRAARERRVDLGEVTATFAASLAGARGVGESGAGAAGAGAGLTVARRFHNNVGFGFEALVNAASHGQHMVKGPLLYVAALLKTLPRFRSCAVRVTLPDAGVAFDGSVAMLAAVNGRRVGGAFLLAPDARIDDGALDLVRVDAMSLARMLWLLPGAFTGRHLRSGRVRVGRFAEILVECPEGIPVYVDGEFLGSDAREVGLRCLPGALRTL